MRKIKVLLFDKEGYYKMSSVFVSEYLAWGYGENWKMLTNGNTYKLQTIPEEK